MTLTLCWEISAADWIADSDLPWPRLVVFGPAGFDAYARLRFLPDPSGPGRGENDVDEDRPPDQLLTLFEVLAGHTESPKDCYACVWEGFAMAGVADDGDAVHLDWKGTGDLPEGSGAEPGWAPAPAAPSWMPGAPMVVVPHRAYWLFRGPLTSVGKGSRGSGWPDRVRLDMTEPAFVWPADHAWCVARDVDPHWAGIGGTRALIDRLVADPRLDVVPADPTGDQPTYQ